MSANLVVSELEELEDKPLPPMAMDVMPSLMLQNLEPITVSVPSEIDLGADRDFVVELTKASIGYHRAASVSAAAMCISLYKLYAAFAQATGKRLSTNWEEGHSPVHGWPAWVSANFEHLGMSMNSIRKAIRSGRAMLSVIDQRPEAAANFAKLSKSAIFTLGNSQPEVAIEVAEILETGTDSLTAREIEEIRERLQRSEQEVMRMQHEQMVHAQATSRMAEQLRQSEQLTIELRDRNSELEIKLKTPVESIVQKLPPGVQTAQEAIDQLKTQRASVHRELEQSTKRLEQVRNEISALERKAEMNQSGEKSIQALKDEVADLMLKFSAPLISSLRKSSSMSRAELASVALAIRGWADQMDPAN